MLASNRASRAPTTGDRPPGRRLASSRLGALYPAVPGRVVPGAEVRCSPRGRRQRRAESPALATIGRGQPPAPCAKDPTDTASVASIQPNPNETPPSATAGEAL
jgi:hypothetical protein